MKTPKKEAACLQQTAEKPKLHNSRAYHKAVPLSSPKFQIGELLLLLLAGHGQPDGWRRFERLLRQFYGEGVL